MKKAKVLSDLLADQTGQMPRSINGGGPGIFIGFVMLSIPYVFSCSIWMRTKIT